MRIAFLGDIMTNEDQLSLIRKGEGYDFSSVAVALDGVFIDSDYVIANLESPVAGKEAGYTSELYSFNTPESILEALKNSGINMVQTSNNHCLDRGVEGLRQTIRNIEASGLAYVGTHMNPEDSFRIINVNGISVGILAYTYGTNAFKNCCYLKSEDKYSVDLLQEQELYGKYERLVYKGSSVPAKVFRKISVNTNPGKYAAPIYDRREPDAMQRSRLREQIAKCRKEGAEFVAVLLHIGGQYNDEPTPYTKEMCAFCMDNGADLVVANHEHVIHPFEDRRSEKSGFCWYALGNFISSNGVISEPFDKLCRYSVVLDSDLKRTDSGISVEYSFRLFLSCENEIGQIIPRPVYDYYEQCKELHMRERLESDVETILNRIYRTEKVSYGIRNSYEIPEKKAD